MLQYIDLPNAALLSGNGTSAHETGTPSSYNTNALRVWNPERQIRRRKPSSTTDLRQVFCAEMLCAYPVIRRIRLRDTGIGFLATLCLHTGKRVHRKACNLKNLHALLIATLECK